MSKIAVLTPIVHLDGVYELLETKGEVFLSENADKESARKLLLEHDIDTILCNPNAQEYKIDEELLSCTKVQLINTCSTGMNHIDVEYCEQNGIEIYSLKNDMELLHNLPSTSELAFGLLMDLSRSITKSNNHLANGGEWNYTEFIGSQIKGMKIGIVGYGRLGKMMTRYCGAFGADIYIYDPYYEFHHEMEMMALEDRFVDSLDELFEKCQAISLHVHVTPETERMINMTLLENGIDYLINTSRGEIVCETSVVTALRAGFLKGYATDVIEDEFGDISESPILQNMNDLNIIVTPHVGGMTIEGQTKAYKWAINKL